jgi:hypothetical protein
MRKKSRRGYGYERFAFGLAQLTSLVSPRAVVAFGVAERDHARNNCTGQDDCAGSRERKDGGHASGRAVTQSARYLSEVRHQRLNGSS